uniref:Uncharacterized protein n=1 Tax=Xenopus tropicalis TaxID=8364 RepID=A0A1B8Y2F3_XENTR
MPSQSSRSLGKDGRAKVLAIPCPARVPRAWGRTGGLMRWLSYAQPEFQEPGEGRSSRSLGKDGLKPWLSHAQPEFKEPGEGRAEALAIPCPARVPRAWGRTG